MLDSTRVSPYTPAADDMPQSMRPDTRQHLTHAPTSPNKKLAFLEASTHELRSAHDSALDAVSEPSATSSPVCSSFPPISSLQDGQATAARNDMFRRQFHPTVPLSVILPKG